MQVTRAIAAALVGAGMMVGGPATAQGRPTDAYVLADVPLRMSASTADRIDIPAGTSIPVEVDEEIPIDQNRMGEEFDAHVKRDVVVNGETVIPAGAKAKVKLAESQEQKDAATLRLTEVEVGGDMHQVSVGDAKADTEDRGLNGMSTGKKTAIGAAAGAVVGAVTGAGVIEGAVVGAGGGLAWGLLSDRDKKIDDGTTVRFELDRRLDMN
jgi:hypothetical protein